MPAIKQDIILNLTGLTKLKEMREETQRLHQALKAIQKVKNVAVTGSIRGANAKKGDVITQSKKEGDAIAKQTRQIDKQTRSVENLGKEKANLGKAPIIPITGQELRRSKDLEDNRRRIARAEERLTKRRFHLASQDKHIDRLSRLPQVSDRDMFDAQAERRRRAGSVTRMSSIRSALVAEGKEFEKALKTQNTAFDKSAKERQRIRAKEAGNIVKASKDAQNNANRLKKVDQDLARNRKALAGVTQKLSKEHRASEIKKLEATKKHLRAEKAMFANRKAFLQDEKKVFDDKARQRESKKLAEERTKAQDNLNKAIKKGLTPSKSLADNQRRLIALGDEKTRVNRKLNTAQQEYNRAIASGNKVAQDVAKSEVDKLNARKRGIALQQQQLQAEAESLAQKNSVKEADKALQKANKEVARTEKELNRARKSGNAERIKAAESANKQALSTQKLRAQVASAARSSRNMTTATRALGRASGSAEFRVRGLAGAAGILGGSLRTMASSAAFHAKSAALVTLFGSLAALRGVYSLIVRPMAEFDKKLALVAKTTKLSKEEVRDYGEQLLSLSSELDLARKELVEISIIAGQMGIRGTENLLEFTRTVAMTNRVSEIEVQRAADAYAALGTAFDIPIEAVGNMGSALNELGNNSIANFKKIVEAMSNVSAEAYTLGLTFSETSAIVATLIQGGLSPSKAGVALRSILVDLQTRQQQISKVLGLTQEEYSDRLQENPLATLQEVLEQMGELDEQQLARVIKQTFSKRHVNAVKLLATNVDLFTSLLEISNESFAEGTSLMNENARAMDNVSTAWSRLGTTLSNFFVGSSPLAQALQNFAELFIPIQDIDTAELLRVAEDLEKAGRGTFATAAVGGAVAGGGLGGILGMIVPGIGNLVGITAGGLAGGITGGVTAMLRADQKSLGIREDLVGRLLDPDENILANQIKETIEIFKEQLEDQDLDKAIRDLYEESIPLLEARIPALEFDEKTRIATLDQIEEMIKEAENKIASFGPKSLGSGITIGASIEDLKKEIEEYEKAGIPIPINLQGLKKALDEMKLLEDRKKELEDVDKKPWDITVDPELERAHVGFMRLSENLKNATELHGSLKAKMNEQAKMEQDLYKLQEHRAFLSTKSARKELEEIDIAIRRAARREAILRKEIAYYKELRDTATDAYVRMDEATSKIFDAISEFNLEDIDKIDFDNIIEPKLLLEYETDEAKVEYLREKMESTAERIRSKFEDIDASVEIRDQFEMVTDLGEQFFQADTAEVRDVIRKKINNLIDPEFFGQLIEENMRHIMEKFDLKALGETLSEEIVKLQQDVQSGIVEASDQVEQIKMKERIEELQRIYDLLSQMLSTENLKPEVIAEIEAELKKIGETRLFENLEDGRHVLEGFIDGSISAKNALEELGELGVTNLRTLGRLLNELKSGESTLDDLIEMTVLGAKDAVHEFLPALEKSKAEISEMSEDMDDWGAGLEEIAKKSDDALKVEKWISIAKYVKQMINDLADLGDIFVGLSQDANQFVGALITAVERAEQLYLSIKDMKALGGFSNLSIGGKFGVASAGLGIVTGIAGVGGSIVNAIRNQRRKAEEQRAEAIRVSKENAKRLEDAVGSLADQLIRGQDITGDQAAQLGGAYSRYQDARTRVDLARNLELTRNEDYVKAYADFANSQDEINQLLEDIGLEPIDWENTTREAIDTYLQGIIDNITQQGAFKDDIDGLLGSIQFLTRFIEQDAADSLQMFTDGISDMEDIPDWMREALSNIDLSTEEGQQSLDSLLEDWARQFAAGEIDFGGLTPTELQNVMDFLQGLLESEGAGGDVSDAMQKLIDSIQFLSKYMEIDAVEAMNRFLLGLGKIEQVPDWMENALAGLDLGTAEGQEELHKLLGEWAEGLEAGSLEIGDLEDADVRLMMDFLQSIADGDFGGRALNELSVRRSITDVQANAVILLLEQMVFWQKLMARKMGVDGEFTGPVIATETETEKEGRGLTREEWEKLARQGPPMPKDYTDGRPIPTVYTRGASREEEVVNMLVNAGKAAMYFDPSQMTDGMGVNNNYNVKIGDIHASSTLNPDDPMFADAVSQAVVTKLRRDSVRRW